MYYQTNYVVLHISTLFIPDFDNFNIILALEAIYLSLVLSLNLNAKSCE